MADDLEIRRGGVVAVDTDTLRAVAHRLGLLALRIGEAADSSRRAAGLFRAVEAVTRDYSEWIATDVAEAIDRAAEDARDLVRRLRETAAVYEIIELRAERAAALAAGDTLAVARIDARAAALADEYPWAWQAADAETAWWRVSAPLELFGQALWWSPLLGPGSAPVSLLAFATALVSWVGAGTIPGSARLVGTQVPVEVRALGPAAASAAPAGLAAAARRVPGGEEARVRVERYTMPDGTREWAVYIAGTHPGENEPFDGTSNAQLYFGERSASYEAVLEALRLAGAEPGDAVLAVGHSQGAMVAARLALESGYDVQTLVSLGSPVEAAVPDSTLSVSLRHTDDPVAALADHGAAAGVGSADSIVAERTADPAAGIHDLGLPAHGIDAYADTAALVDGAADPRVDAVREVFAHLATATSVDATEYSATRPGGSPEVSPLSAADEE